MRKPDWAVLLATVLYSLLFFEQAAGLNLLLFTVALIVMQVWIRPVLLKQNPWLLSALMCLFSAAGIVVYGSALAVMANVVCLLWMNAAAFSPRSSVLINITETSFSIATSVLQIFKPLFEKKEKSPETVPARTTKPLTVIVPLLIGLLFFVMYRIANPLFDRFVQKINLDFLNLDRLLFTFLGLLLVWGAIKQNRIPGLTDWEEKQRVPQPLRPLSQVWDAAKAFLLVLVILNLMLVLINGLDINYLYMGAGMPQGITHKQFVHNGVNMLIFSIILLIITLLYFLRHVQLNSQRFLWPLLVLLIVQNLMMVSSTAVRNSIYIEEALLTYKRIGVYYWLLMAALGLISLLITIRSQKNHWYLIRINSLFAIMLLTFSAAVDWDRLISTHNISNVSQIKELDKRYLLSLSETNIGQLYAIRRHPHFNRDTFYHYRFFMNESNRAVLDKKLYDFLQHNKNKDWRSFSLRRKRVLNEVQELSLAGELDTLDLSAVYKLDGMSELKELKGIQHLNLGYNGLDTTTCQELNTFKKLRSLELGLYESGIKNLPLLRNINTIYLQNSDSASISAVRREAADKKIIVLNPASEKKSDAR